MIPKNQRNANHRKGITPIIAVIILLLITVALAGVAWSYLQGFLNTQISKTFTIPSGGAYCQVDTTDPTQTDRVISVYIVNTGYQTNIKDTDFIIVKVDGTTVPVAAPIPWEIKPNQAGLVISYTCTGLSSACTQTSSSFSGFHTIDLGTSGSVVHPRVVCP